MAAEFIIDTDVAIDYLRSQSQAVTWLESLSEQLAISVISVAELFSGVREGTERPALENFCQLLKFFPSTNESQYKEDFIAEITEKVME